MHIRVFPDSVTRCIRQKITFISRQCRAGEAIEGDLLGFPAARRSMPRPAFRESLTSRVADWQALHKTFFLCRQPAENYDFVLTHGSALKGSASPTNV
jgi:hypothetical protein